MDLIISFAMVVWNMTPEHNRHNANFITFLRTQNEY